jgi:acyl carrier protein
MTREETFGKVREVLVDALAVDEEEVTPKASLFKDLGAESIDVLDIQFKLEQEFGIKIDSNELNPAGVMQDPKYVKDGRVTPEGLVELKTRLPHVNLSEFEKDPQVSKVADMFTVEALVNFVERKTAAK